MKVNVRVANDQERQEHKLVVIEAEGKIYNLNYRNAFAFISSLEGDEDFKPFIKRCEKYESAKELEDYFEKHNIKFSN